MPKMRGSRAAELKEFSLFAIAHIYQLVVDYSTEKISIQQGLTKSNIL